MTTLDETKFVGFFITFGESIHHLDGSQRLERLNAIGVPYVLTEVRFRQPTLLSNDQSIIAALVSPDDAVVVKLLNHPEIDRMLDFVDIKKDVYLTKGATLEFDPHLVHWDPLVFHVA